MSRESKDECNIQVAVRFRPFTKDEKLHNGDTPFKCNRFTNEVTTKPIKGESVTYDFDNVFSPSTTQEEIFNRIAKPVIDDMLLGFNCTIFAYGQTGTGKTYTMEGNLDNPDDHGIIPRSVEYIFERLRSYNTDQYHVKISFLEIYNEELYDLLDDDNTKKIKIHEDTNQGASCRNQTEIVGEDIQTIFDIMHKALKRRKTAETNLNVNSSRSHCIFSINVELLVFEGTREYVRSGKLNLVDLAGSECIGRSGAINQRAREAGNINQSLLALARVIMALVDNKKYIPYRDSKLTHLLRESLGGKAKTCIIATCSPSFICFEETENTLKYAYNAKHIKNKPTKNMVATQASIIKELQMENEELKAKLCQNWEQNGVNISYLEYENMTKKVQEEKSNRLKLETELSDMNHYNNQLLEENEKKDKLLEAYKLYIENLDKEKHELLSIIQNIENILNVLTENKKQKDQEIDHRNNTLTQSIQQEIGSLSSLLQSYRDSNISSFIPLQTLIDDCISTAYQNFTSVNSIFASIQSLYAKINEIQLSQYQSLLSMNTESLTSIQESNKNSSDSLSSLLVSYNNQIQSKVNQFYELYNKNHTDLVTSFKDILLFISQYEQSLHTKSDHFQSLLLSYSTSLQATIEKYISQLSNHKNQFLSKSKESKKYLETKTSEYLVALKTLTDQFITVYNQEYLHLSNQYQSFMVEQENRFQTIHESNNLLLSEHQKQFMNIYQSLYDEFQTSTSKFNHYNELLTESNLENPKDSISLVTDQLKDQFNEEIQKNYNTLNHLLATNSQSIKIKETESNKQSKTLTDQLEQQINQLHSSLFIDSLKTFSTQHQDYINQFQTNISTNYNTIDQKCKLLSENIHNYIYNNMKPQSSTDLTPIKKSFNLQSILHNDNELVTKFQAIKKSIEDESISKKKKLNSNSLSPSQLQDEDFFN